MTALDRIREIEDRYNTGYGDLPDIQFLLRAFNVAFKMLAEINVHFSDGPNAYYEDLGEEFEKRLAEK